MLYQRILFDVSVFFSVSYENLIDKLSSGHVTWHSSYKVRSDGVLSMSLNTKILRSNDDKPNYVILFVFLDNMIW